MRIDSESSNTSSVLSPNSHTSKLSVRGGRWAILLKMKLNLISVEGSMTESAVSGSSGIVSSNNVEVLSKWNPLESSST